MLGYEDLLVASYEALTAQFREFTEVLEMEHTALVNRNVDALMGIVMEKQNLCMLIEERAEQIRLLGETLMKREDLSIAWKKRLSRISTQVIGGLKNIQKKNQYNHLYIQESLKAMDDIICLLKAGAAGDQAYTPDLKTKGRLPGRFLHTEV
jgi:hypothetical protein